MASRYATSDQSATEQKHAPEESQQQEDAEAPESVLKDDDALFLNRHMSRDEAPAPASDQPAAVVQDDGEVREASQEDVDKNSDQVVLPESRPETSRSAKSKKDTGPEFPSQEEAEAAMRGFDGPATEPEGGKQQGEKRTWTSYLPSVPYGTKKSGSASVTDNEKSKEEASSAEDAGDYDVQEPPTTSTQRKQPQTWAEYAQNYMPATSEQHQTWAQFAQNYIPTTAPSMPSLPQSWKKSASNQPSDSAATTTEASNAEKPSKVQTQTQELTHLLTSLDLSPLQSRLIPLSTETRALSASFAQILRDLLSGGPTAYEDMENFLREAGPRLEKQWGELPPVVRGLVRGLPGRVAPVAAGMVGEKGSSGGEEKAEEGGGVEIDESIEDVNAATGADGQRKRSTIPGLKSLITRQGAVGTLLRNVVEFLQTRFPFLAAGTNVVMSLAVFILMFVFWYCWKRGREVRLAREAEELDAGGSGVSAESSEGEGEVGKEKEKAANDEEGGGRGEDEAVAGGAKKSKGESESLEKSEAAEVGKTSPPASANVADERKESATTEGTGRRMEGGDETVK